ncbi:hypothetical protein K469DRAFT_705173 [Zopfia rhizophila CBS 207.26]|uniref:Isopenicillin N synthase-like Fe(2+) 2OG dioxygenase domain-containing protein n=1 Tax=Zopfia rhizophila CBS 207.26 TaxID=1314779 RepID=A0A6A6EAC5_9PEZI|nr:hypothetical protein K469DRAFT_705173 [Zopfia rhizophila CBS 207.26]
MALSLGLDVSYFDVFAAGLDGICLCRAHHYPPTSPDAADRTRGVGAHTDFGALTLLLQDTVGGAAQTHRGLTYSSTHRRRICLQHQRLAAALDK